MRKQFSYGLVLFAVLIVSLLFYANFRFAKSEPGGTDFLYRWLPTRLVFLGGYNNPYSPDVEYQVELAHYGRAHHENEFPGLFSYPYYTMFALLPFALIRDFAIARAAWMTLLELAHIAIIFLTLKMVNLKPSSMLAAALILFALLSADFVQPIIDGNPSSMSALFVVLSLYFLSRDSDRLAGMFLAFSTVKPQLVILFFALACIWALSRRRWVFIYSTAITMLVLFGLSFLLLPTWLVEFVKDVMLYPAKADPSTPRAIFSYWMPIPLAQIFALALTSMSVLVIFLAWRGSFKKDFSALLWAACVTFAAMPLTGITTAKSNYIAMLPGVILLVKAWLDKFKGREIFPSMILIAWIGLSWLFFYAGRTWVVGGRLIYFVDFYPMPIVLLALYFLENASLFGVFKKKR